MGNDRNHFDKKSEKCWRKKMTHQKNAKKGNNFGKKHQQNISIYLYIAN
jgi:hypothetical protein